jgi:hypothetical protein
MAVGAFSGVGEARFFFGDFRVDAFPFPIGVGDFFGLADDGALFSAFSD